ncbi:hypothetical protein CH293_27215 [Rhodococcus sp. 14-2470-1b]|nr:hypothetical protein CH301_05480 [Rhodococcus sp. 15-1189-1-1a]OZF18624.1 hypothetical protein CH299_06025 [Rhodococcus sp. 14-2686-1-2]OZF41969.1 hypothetical protein CH293_27215 [Rhodococcus sp. 14-2470-1b]
MRSDDGRSAARAVDLVQTQIDDLLDGQCVNCHECQDDSMIGALELLEQSVQSVRRDRAKHPAVVAPGDSSCRICEYTPFSLEPTKKRPQSGVNVVP